MLQTSVAWSLLLMNCSFSLLLTCIIEYRPEIFKSTTLDDSNGSCKNTSQQEDDELDASDDDGLPPLEANMNRIKPPEFQSDESDSGSETDS